MIDQDRWEGNSCNMHLLDLGKTIKAVLEKDGMLAWQCNTIGVSDAITMGSDGQSLGRRASVCCEVTC